MSNVKVKDYAYILKALLVKLQNENPEEVIELKISYRSIGLDDKWLYAINKVELQNENIDQSQKEIISRLSENHFKDKLFNLSTLADLLFKSGDAIGHDQKDHLNPHITIVSKRVFDKAKVRKYYTKT